MNRKITIRAAEGRLVDDPATGNRITDTPVTVDDSPFWRRRIKGGDVVKVDGGAPKVQKFQPESVDVPQPVVSPSAKSKSKN